MTRRDPSRRIHTPRPPGGPALEAFARWLEGESPSALAAAYGVPLGAVQGWISRAKAWHEDQRNRRASGIGGAT